DVRGARSLRPRRQAPGWSETGIASSCRERKGGFVGSGSFRGHRLAAPGGRGRGRMRSPEGAERSARAGAPRLPQPHGAARRASGHRGGAARALQAHGCAAPAGALPRTPGSRSARQPEHRYPTGKKSISRGGGRRRGRYRGAGCLARGHSAPGRRGARARHRARMIGASLRRTLLYGIRCALCLPVWAFAFRVSAVDFAALVAFNCVLWILVAGLRVGFAGEIDYSALLVYLATVPLVLAAALLVALVYGAQQRLLAVAIALTASDPVFELAGFALPYLAAPLGALGVFTTFLLLGWIWAVAVRAVAVSAGTQRPQLY